MSDKPIPPVPAGVLTEEQIEAISGGNCSVQTLIDIAPQLRQAYDTLVDFTSYVIERVATSRQ